MVNKICNKCNIEKSIDNFTLRKGSKDGYRNQCKDCRRNFSKKYRENNRDKIRAIMEGYYQDNKDKKKQYYQDNKDKKKQYYQNNKDRIKQYYQNKDKDIKVYDKEKRKEYIKKKRKTDILFRLKQNISNSIRTALKKKCYTKKSRTHEILGCSYVDFKIYLESLFESWMTWDNRGLYNGELQYGWDIDHIIPLSTATNEEDIIKLNHYTNLQPLCSKINRDIKKDKI